MAAPADLVVLALVWRMVEELCFPSCQVGSRWLRLLVGVRSWPNSLGTAVALLPVVAAARRSLVSPGAVPLEAGVTLDDMPLDSVASLDVLLVARLLRALARSILFFLQPLKIKKREKIVDVAE